MRISDWSSDVCSSDLTIEERRASERDLLAHYRAALVATGAEGVPNLDNIFEQYRRWVIYGMQAWIANMDFWGQIGLPMTKRFFTAGEDLETWKLLLNDRSEEHTSALQPLLRNSYAVFCLKNKKRTRT